MHWNHRGSWKRSSHREKRDTKCLHSLKYPSSKPDRTERTNGTNRTKETEDTIRLDNHGEHEKKEEWINMKIVLIKIRRWKENRFFINFCLGQAIQADRKKSDRPLEMRLGTHPSRRKEKGERRKEEEKEKEKEKAKLRAYHSWAWSTCTTYFLGNKMAAVLGKQVNAVIPSRIKHSRN